MSGRKCSDKNRKKVARRSGRWTVVVREVCRDCLKAGRIEPCAAGERRFPMTARTLLGLDLGLDSRATERLAEFVASRVDFPMDEQWGDGCQPRARAVLREATRYGDQFLACPEVGDSEFRLLLAGYLDSVARMLRDFGFVDRQAYDDALITVGALAASAQGPRMNC